MDTPDEKTLEAIIKAYKDLDAACEVAIEAGCMVVDGPLFQAIWRAFDTMLRQADPDGWIAWFIWDNSCGEKGCAARAVAGKRLRKVKTCADLAQVIAESRNTER